MERRIRKTAVRGRKDSTPAERHDRVAAYPRAAPRPRHAVTPFPGCFPVDIYRLPATAFIVVRMDNLDDMIMNWFRANAGKLIWLLVVLVAAWVADRVLRRVLRKVLDNSQIPSASIFINLMRVVVWCAAATMVLQPVFGINPTTLVTALGVGGVALALGLKDTIANVIGTRATRSVQKRFPPSVYVRVRSAGTRLNTTTTSGIAIRYSGPDESSRISHVGAPSGK